MRKLKFVGVFLSIILLLTVEIQAYTVELVGNQSKIEAGDKVVVSISFEGLEEKIDAYQGTLLYNRNHFKTVKSSNFEVKNGWNGLVYNETNGTFVVERNIKSDADEEILTVMLECNSTVEPTELNIAVENNVVSGGNKDIKAANASLKISVVKDDSYGYEIENNYIDRVKPKTPINDFKNILLNGKNSKVTIKENGKNVTSGYMKTGMTVEVIEDGQTVTYTVVVIGDINSDGISDSIDTQMLKAYRNEVLKLESEKFKAADINDDGKVNVKDSKLLLYHRAGVEGYNLNYSK